MKYKFQHFIDISTSAESMQSITFSVGGEDVIKRCAHLFNAYKYFKLGKITVKFVPASTLPVDPLGMGYGDTDPQTVDPRDQLNPGVVRIINGEDVCFEDLSMGNYEAMLLDPRWYKFSLQSGFKRSAYPLYWQIGQLHQDQYPGATVNIPTTTVFSTSLINPSTLTFSYNGDTGVDASGSSTSPRLHFIRNFSDDKGIFQVGRRGRIGWLPTDAYQYLYNGETGYAVPMVHPVPRINVIQCFLPKAYKTLYYYRVYITEEVMFSGLKSISPYTEIEGSTPYNFRSPDVFLEVPDVTPRDPRTGDTINIGKGLSYQKFNDGDGNGSD